MVFYSILVLESPVKNMLLRFAFVLIGTCRERLGGSQGRGQPDNPTWWKKYHLALDEKTAPILAV